MKTSTLLTLSLLAACSLGFTPITGFAAEKKPATAAAATDTSKPIPYHGTTTKIDEAGKSFSIKGKAHDRVFAVTETTVVTRDNVAAKLSDLKVGEEVRGQATKTGEAWTATKVMIGPKEVAAKAKGGTTEATTEPTTTKEGTAPVKAPKSPKSGGVNPAAAPANGAGSPNSSSAGPAVQSVPQSGGQAPAGAKKD